MTNRIAIWTAVAVMMLLTTVPARACSATVVNASHETIAYTCYLPNLTEVAEQAPPAPAPPAPVTILITHKCWFNYHHHKRWHRC